MNRRTFTAGCAALVGGSVLSAATPVIGMESFLSDVEALILRDRLVRLHDGESAAAWLEMHGYAAAENCVFVGSGPIFGDAFGAPRAVGCSLSFVGCLFTDYDPGTV